MCSLVSLLLTRPLDERNFERPNHFIPARWTSHPDLILRKDVFKPFGSGMPFHPIVQEVLADMSTGIFGCGGKRLGQLHVNLVTASLLLRFDIALAPDEDGHRLLHESKDHYIVRLSPCELTFKRRLGMA